MTHAIIKEAWDGGCPRQLLSDAGYQLVEMKDADTAADWPVLIPSSFRSFLCPSWNES